MNRYPDVRASELVEAIAARFGVATDWVAPGAGSAGVLHQIVQAFTQEGDEVLHPWPSFEAYPSIIRLSGGTPVAVPLAADGGMDLPAMREAVTERTRVILICSPNNPTGPIVHRDEFESFLAEAPHDVVVVLDEAYVEYVRDPQAADGLDLLSAHQNLCVLRTFSKAYGLAGLRVGYALAHPPVAQAVREHAVPFAISTVGQYAVIESLRREDEIRSRIDEVVSERRRVQEALLRQGWATPDTQANFVWLPTGPRSGDFAAACKRAGFLVQPFAEGCRVTIGNPADNDRFLDTAQQWLREEEGVEVASPTP
jgi:histidinol-phosphate aminotransferase